MTGLLYVNVLPCLNTWLISLSVITNIALVSFWLVLLSPYAIRLKSHPKALCHVLAVAGSRISF